MREPPKLDAKKITEFLGNMKKQVAQIDGEASMMRNDAATSLFQNFGQMINQVWGEKENVEHKLLEATATLEKIYQGHPDIQIAIEKEAKETRAKIDSKTAKITKKK